MIPDVKEAEEEGKQKAKQVNDDLEVFDNDKIKNNNLYIYLTIYVSLISVLGQSWYSQNGSFLLCSLSNSFYNFQYYLLDCVHVQVITSECFMLSEHRNF